MAKKGGNMDDSIKKAKAYNDALNSVNKTLNEQDSAMEEMSKGMGIAYSSFLTQTKKTQEERLKEIDLINQANKSMKAQKKSLGETLSTVLNLEKGFSSLHGSSDRFSKIISSIDMSKLSGEYNDILSVQSRLNELGLDSANLTKDQISEMNTLKQVSDSFQNDTIQFMKDNQEHFQEWLDGNKEMDDILNELPLDNIVDKMEFVKKLLDGQVVATEQILATNIMDVSAKEDILKLTQKIGDSQEVINDLQEESNNQMKQEIGFRNNLANLIKSNSKEVLRSVWDSIKLNNQAFKDAQKNFGIILNDTFEASAQMAVLTSEAARFGVSTKDTLELMGQMGEELRTISTVHLSDSVGHFLAIQKAVGISSSEVTNIAGEMMRAGRSAADVEKYMEGTNKMAKLFGVNSKKVLQGISRNIDKMRQMGFVGGEESLARMVSTAERLRMNVDEIFDVAEKSRSIEGAMDMAAQLQLAGGSFANINPMDLLAAARKGPEELQGILTKMGSDIGSWNKETGEYQFDPVDVDRLKMVADATGQSMDSIQKMIQKNAEDSRKLDFMPDLALGEIMGPDGKPLSQDMMDNMLSDSIDINGSIIEGSLLSEAGVSDLASMTSEQAKTAINDHMNKQKTLEEQALANQSFDDSITAFKDSIMSLFTVFQPIIDVFSSFIQTVNGMGPIVKGLVAALIGFVAIAPKIGKGLEAFSSMKNGIKGIIGKRGGPGDIASSKSSIPGAGSKDVTPSGGGGLKNLSEGLKAMGGKGISKGILNTALAGPALALMIPGLPTILLMGAVGAIGKLVEQGFRSVANGISYMGQAKGLAKGAVAMVLVGASLVPFAFALQMMSEVGWDSVLMAITMMAAGVLSLMVIGALVTGPGGLMLLMGALALVAVGVALMAFGASLIIFAQAAQLMQGMEFGWLGDLGWNLLIASPGLLLGGMALLAASPALALGSMALLVFAKSANVISQVDWTSFATMGDALLSVVPGLLGFSLAGLMFVNPITMLGMVLMVATLGALSAVMVPLSKSLELGSNGLHRFADGLDKLQKAANSLDLKRLESLKELSYSFAASGSAGGGGVGDAVDKISKALEKMSGGSGGSSGGKREITVNLKLNGRDLQSIIIDDTKIVS